MSWSVKSSNQTNSVGPVKASQILSATSTASSDDVWSVNTRLENLRLTAAYLSGISQTSMGPDFVNCNSAVPQIKIDLPHFEPGKVVESPVKNDNVVYINPLENKAEISDPLRSGATTSIETPAPNDGGIAIEKWAHRLLVIRKKKMKQHRRKRLWKKMWTTFKKRFYGRERKREIAYRTKLNAAVSQARKFDAEKYVDSYLKDYHYEFIPQTYKGMKKPKNVVLELMERDKQVKVRMELNNTNLVTGQKLKINNESVTDFVKRHSGSKERKNV